MDIPVDIITFKPLPDYLKKCLENTSRLEYNILPLTPDEYKVWKEKSKPPEGFLRRGHAPYKHIKEITYPKMLKLSDQYNGFFIMEGDVIIDDNFTPEFFKSNFDTSVPQWLGYKKILYKKGKIDYIVGNFLLYFPVSSLETLGKYLQKKKNIFSDRFFTRLVLDGFIKLNESSVACEIPHISGTTGKWRD